MIKFILRCRRMIVISIHLLLIILASYLAFQMAFNNVVPQLYMTQWMQMVPWLVIIGSVTFIPFRLYKGLWRYTRIWDLRNIVARVLTSSFILFGLTYFGIGIT